MSSKREGELKSAAMKELRRQCPSFLILLQATAGAPDRLIVGNGCTTGWEFKHATPDAKFPGHQALLCARLCAQGLHVRYVVWIEARDGSNKQIMIVMPHRIIEGQRGFKLQPEASCYGFDHKWLVEQISEAHGV